MKLFIVNFPFIAAIFFLIAAIKGCKKGRQVGLKYFGVAILVLALQALMEIHALTEVVQSQGMGKAEVMAQHIGKLLLTGAVGSILANMSYVAISFSNFRKKYVIIDTLIMLTFITMSLCSHVAFKFFEHLGAAQ